MIVEYIKYYRVHGEGASLPTPLGHAEKDNTGNERCERVTEGYGEEGGSQETKTKKLRSKSVED